MAQHFYDFAGETIGQLPSGWTARWDQTDQWSIQNPDVGESAERALLFAGENTTANTLITRDELDGSDVVEIVVRVTATAQANLSFGRMRAIVRASGTGTTETGYFADLSGSGGDAFVLGKLVNGAFTELDSMAVPLPGLQNGVWYWIRLRVNGTSIQAKYWVDGTSEPDWQLSATDSDIDDGWVGVGARWSTRYFDVVGVGTGGDSAPTAGAPAEHDLAGGTAFELASGGALEQEHVLAGGTAFEFVSGAEVDVVAAHELEGGTAFNLASGGALQQDHVLAGGTAFEMVSGGVLQVDNATLLAGGTAFEFVSGGEMPGDHPLRAGTAFLLVSGAGLAQPTQFRAGTAFRLESGDAYSGPGTGLVVPVTPALVPVPSAGALPAPIADPFVNVREGDEFPVLLPWAGIAGMSGLARVLSRSVSDEWGRQRLNVQFVRQPDPDTVPQLGAGAVVPYHEPVKGDLRQITRIRQRQERERRR